MNLTCAICSDLLIPHSESDVYSTSCGHLFHYVCLLQWITQSSTCPQCRHRNTQKSIHRIYFNVVTNNETDDPAVLQNKLDNLQFQLKLKERDLKSSSEECDELQKQNLRLRKEVKALEDKSRTQDSATRAFKEQLIYWKEQCKHNQKLVEEVVKMKKKIVEMENVNLVISGSKQQVDDMLKQNRDPETLSMLVSALKQELLDSERRKNQMRKMLKEVQVEAASSRREVTSMSDQIQRLRQDVECHKNCHAEKKYLKKKITDYKMCMENSPGDHSLRRIVAESPPPLPRDFQQTSDVIRDENVGIEKETDVISPAPAETEPEINDAESPYLRLKSCSVLFPKPSDALANRQAHKYSIFKRSVSKIGFDHIPIVKPAPNPDDVSYDGLGGHSKVDDYPSSSQISRVKRKRITYAKYKKLAPYRKLDQYFDKT